MRGLLLPAILFTGLETTTGWTQEPNDTVADLQSNSGFNSIEDGQPGAPGELQFELDLGWVDVRGDASTGFIDPQLEYTFAGSRFLRNAELQLAMPVQATGGILSMAPSFVSWQQRWVANPNLLLTVASLLQVQIPTGPDPARVGATLVGIVVKQVGPGSLYLNGFVSAGGGAALPRSGLVVGYRLPVSSAAGLTANYVRQRQKGEPPHDEFEVADALELSADYAFTDRFTIGPGILFGLDRGRLTPRFGGGIRFLFTF